MLPAEARFSFATEDRIAVVAPHPDDDVLGCGAMLAAAANAGVASMVAYITDGSRSHPGSRRFPPQRLRAIREREALAALACCGILARAATFFRVPDGRCETLAPRERATVQARLAAVLAAWKPTIVFAPWRRDPHPDHRAVARFAYDACVHLGRNANASCRPRYLEYPVWLAERGAAYDEPRAGEARRLVFTFGEAIAARKREALAMHRSQMTALINDDPAAFRLPSAMFERACASPERYFEAYDA